MDKTDATPEERDLVLVKTDDHELLVRLTEAEIADYTIRAADADRKIIVLNDELKSAQQEIKGRISDAQKERTKLLQAVRTGDEMRDVPVEVYAMRETRELVWMRTDTQECIKRRPMTAPEISMFFPAPSAKQREQATSKRFQGIGDDEPQPDATTPAEATTDTPTEEETE